MRRTPLGPLHEARGAHWMERDGWEIPAFYANTREEYQALQEGVGLLDLSFRGLMRITGRDRRSWLQGQVTQDVASLPDGRGTYAAIINPKGRLISDLRIFALPDALLVDFPAGIEVSLPEYLEHYLIMERAEIEDLSEDWALLSVQGPHACSAIEAQLGEEVADLPLWSLLESTCEGEPLYITRVAHCGEDAFDLFMPQHKAAMLWGILNVRRQEFAVYSLGWEAFDIRRVEAGVPLWGAELGPNVVPQEARLDNAVSYDKGCYVGQEIMARIHARGQVNNLLAGFFVLGDKLPPIGTEIHQNGKTVGRITSAVHSIRLDRPVALGYLRRELQDPGTQVEAALPDGTVALEVTTLPFVPHDYRTE